MVALHPTVRGSIAIFDFGCTEVGSWLAVVEESPERHLGHVLQGMDAWTCMFLLFLHTVKTQPPRFIFCRGNVVQSLL
jgi:hypothetical protein